MKLIHIIPLAAGFLSVEVYTMIYLNKQPHAPEQCRDSWYMEKCPHPDHRGEVVDGHLLCKCVRK